MLPVLRHADGSAYVNVIPLRLGELTLRITGWFSDGGNTQVEERVTVDPPDRSPDKLIVGDGNRKIWLFLNPQGRRVLGVEALYGNEKQRIEINAAFVSFALRTANDVPIIELDRSTGLIKPIQMGEALVRTTFGGWTALTCVRVENERNFNEGPTPSCETLLQHGEKLGVPTRTSDFR